MCLICYGVKLRLVYILLVFGMKLLLYGRDRVTDLYNHVWQGYFTVYTYFVVGHKMVPPFSLKYDI